MIQYLPKYMLKIKCINFCAEVNENIRSAKKKNLNLQKNLDSLKHLRKCTSITEECINTDMMHKCRIPPSMKAIHTAALVFWIPGRDRYLKWKYKYITYMAICISQYLFLCIQHNVTALTQVGITFHCKM